MHFKIICLNLKSWQNETFSTNAIGFCMLLDYWKYVLQVNLFQKHLLLHQLTHNMTKDCSLIYQFSTWKLQAQNILMSKQKQTIYVHNMFWAGKSMNNIFSYCGLFDARISASGKDLPVIEYWQGFYLINT